MKELHENSPIELIFKGVDLKRYNDTLFLDRDGVINILKPNDYVKNWSEFEFRKEFLPLLPLLPKIFKRVIIVTNQRGVGKGLMTEKNLLEIHENMCKEIENMGGRIDKIYYCTSVDPDDKNRKPNPGMAFLAMKDFPDIDLSRSVMVGDSDSDMEFARKAGIFGIKI